ncbi:hypothetical protein AUJ10_00775 [Candidatus Pacearchaeota archaeon CG1_02_31_27]|nr:MAG: hypothetical protein AUJ10_00775 [Candidatus Pacearchaeota archaeon CG1_02_31_27]PIZ80759.1 MAG: hypothetical protein COX99_01745 [Candidatus Pacearchaeota archaeon CG_4_10_14_0_2_um_filter_31_10]
MEKSKRFTTTNLGEYGRIFQLNGYKQFVVTEQEVSGDQHKIDVYSLGCRREIPCDKHWDVHEIIDSVKQYGGIAILNMPFARDFKPATDDDRKYLEQLCFEKKWPDSVPDAIDKDALDIWLVRLARSMLSGFKFGNANDLAEKLALKSGIPLVAVPDTSLRNSDQYSKIVSSFIYFESNPFLESSGEKIVEKLRGVIQVGENIGYKNYFEYVSTLNFLTIKLSGRIARQIRMKSYYAKKQK